MSTKKGANFGIDHHFSNYGNSHVMVMQHTVTADDADTDVIRMGRVSSGFNYTGLVVARDATLGVGITVDVGIVDNESGVTTDDHFAATLDVASAGRADVVNEPVLVEDHHELIVTLNGDATDGTTITLIATGTHNGA